MTRTRCYICGELILGGQWSWRTVNGSPDHKLYFHIPCKQQREMREKTVEELEEVT